MLKLVSKTICLSLIGLFNPLEAFQKHQKDGFFIEAGFETGLLEGTQTKEQTITQNTQNTQKIYENPLTHSQIKEQPTTQRTKQKRYGHPTKRLWEILHPKKRYCKKGEHSIHHKKHP
ncbi:hypothetical protein HpEKA39_07850 [Helicobacter pylori]